MTVPPEDLSILLSREELIYLLYLLKAEFIAGLDPDPLGEPTKEQKGLALAHAERALRARDLVTLDEKGELVVRETLLLIIGTCAYPELMISLHHFPTKRTPRRFFWNLRSGVIVAHGRPESPLHSFSLLKDRDLLCQQIMSNCSLIAENKPDLPEVITSNQVLKTARETAAQDLPRAIEILTSSGVNTQSARELCGVLANEHAVSALNVVAQQSEETTLQETVTVLSGQSSTWLMTGQGQDQVSLKVIDQSELFAILLRWSNLVENWPEVPAVS